MTSEMPARPHQTQERRREPAAVATGPGPIVTDSGSVVPKPKPAVTNLGPVVTDPGFVVTASSSAITRMGGVLFAVAGVVTAAGSILHPTGGTSSYHSSIAHQLASPVGSPAAWMTMVGSLLLAWALWVLLDGAWGRATPLVRIGARLGVIGSVLLVVESAVTLAMRTAAAPYATGTPVPMVRLSEALYAGCLPALMLGALLINLGSPRLAPMVIRILGAIGMVAMGLAGPLVDGIHTITLWPLYLGGALVCLWIVWVGVHQAMLAGAGRLHSHPESARLESGTRSL